MLQFDEACREQLEQVVPLPLPRAFEDHMSWWPERRARLLSLQWFFQRVSM